MSFWLYGPKEGTRRHLFLVGTHPLVIFLAVSVLMIVLTPAVQWLRSVIR